MLFLTFLQAKVGILRVFLADKRASYKNSLTLIETNLTPTEAGFTLVRLTYTLSAQPHTYSDQPHIFTLDVRLASAAL